MDRFSRLCLFLAAAASLAAACQAPVSEPLKPRIVVLTDIGPAEVEPDDNESAVRLLSYADRFEIEGLITTIGWNCDPYPEAWAEYLFRVIDGYEVDVNNLMKRSGQTGFRSPEEEQGAQALGYWPSAGYLRSRAVMGSTRAGIGVIGEGNDSPGSELLIRLADEDDPRPIWVCSWGGANTLSQAIWKVQQTRSPEEFQAFLRKFRLYTITDQDMVWAVRMNRAYSSHQWLRREFADDLLLVWDESAWLNQNALGVQNWEKYAALIQGHGEMGKVDPHYLWGVEGDTPSFLNSAGAAATSSASPPTARHRPGPIGRNPSRASPPPPSTSSTPTNSTTSPPACNGLPKAPATAIQWWSSTGRQGTSASASRTAMVSRPYP